MRGPRVSLIAVSLVALAASREAHAGQPVLVLEFGGEPADSAAALSKAMAGAVRASGGEAKEASREDVLTLAGCGEPSDDCLRQALGVLDAHDAVTGDVKPTGGGVSVELRAISATGEPRTRTVELHGASAAEQARAFAPEAEAFWNDQPSPAESAAAQAPPETPAADLSQTSESEPAASFSAGRVKPWAWAIAGSGAGLVAVGAVLLVASHSKQGEVDDAPTDTVEDLEHLADLEASGRRYARWGNVLVLVGGVGAAVGGYLVWRQGRTADAEVTVTPSAGDGGVGAAVLVRGRF
jgi:hypothetical protein